MSYPTDIPLLFQKYPQLKERIPWLSLGDFPTPVGQLESLGGALGFDSLWIKQDGGSNKVRKLEYLLADAKRKGCSTLFAVGPTGSNHVRATAVYGKSAGFEVHCLLFNQPHTDYLEGNFNAISTHAVRIKQVAHWGPVVLGYEYLKQCCFNSGYRYLLAPGGSSPLGCLGYVNAAFELKAQIEAGMLPEPKLIFVALGTCGTMAGLVVGTRLAGLQSRIIGVRVVGRVMGNRWRVARLARRTLKLINPSEAISRREIALWHHDFGRGYAIPTEDSLRAVQLMREHEGIQLENTYTGKALAGLIRYVETYRCEEQPILFWNTYGEI
jgi:D-cysteine desulfhydrase